MKLTLNVKRCAAAIDLALTTATPPPPLPPIITTLFSLLARTVSLSHSRSLPSCQCVYFSAYLFHLNVTYKSSHFQSVYIRKERVTRIIFILLYFVNAHTFRRHFNFSYTFCVRVCLVLFGFILSYFLSPLNNLLLIY